MQEERNRNALRSRRLIRDAFMELCEERGASRIPVTEICRRAGISRATFYAHYETVEMLEDSLWRDYVEGIGVLVEEALAHDFLDDPLPQLERIGDYIASNRPIYQAFVSHHRETESGYGFGMIVREALLRHAGSRSGEELLRFDFVAGALVNAYYTWMVGGYGDLPIHEFNLRMAWYTQQCARLYEAKTGA